MMKAVLRVACVLFALTCLNTQARADTQTITVSGELRVFDGDTLEIGPLIVRIHGIDAPEAGQTCNLPSTDTWPCGEAAAERVEELISGSELDCMPLDRDRWGRIISRCMVDGVDIGRQLVSEGLAWAFVEYSSDYVDEENGARATNIGIWQAQNQTAVEYRAGRWARAVASSPRGCPIKGNANGEKIYHTPWSPYYSRVQIDVERGEKWFCDEAEALREGWRAARSR